MSAPAQVSIPIIDTRPENGQAAQQLLDAAREYGFVFVANNAATGISPADIDHMFHLSQAFFASPLPLKQEVSIHSNKAGKNHGWLGQGVEKLDPKVQKRPDVKEAFNLGLPLNDGTFDQPIPQSFQSHLPAITAFQTACHNLCQHLLTLFATALHLPDHDWFTSRHDPAFGPTSTIFRFLYYPLRPTLAADADDIRAGAHSDYGSLTLLFQQPHGAPGLEIQTPSGAWATVPVSPAASDDPVPILVNIGDLLEDWTNGLLRSTVHRVVFPPSAAVDTGADRYSMAYFCHPLDSALLEPVPSRLVQDRAPRADSGRATTTARDHLMERLAATYSV